MASRRAVKVSPADAFTRLDVFIAGADEQVSRSAAAKMIEAGLVLVAGEPQSSKKYQVQAGDMVVYEVIEQPGISLAGEQIPLDIRFEDDYLIVLSKQAGLVCHPSEGHESGTLANALIYHCGIDHLGMLQGEDRPGIVHRLDQDTTGLMLAAKDDATQEALQDAIRIRSIDRRYLTLVHGYIAPDTGLIDAPIARGAKDRMRMEVSFADKARSCVTTFTVLERFEAGPNDEGYTLVECKLYTGRTHQIRVHMNYIKHACVGDPLYGINKPKADLGLGRQFLHSYSLKFEHPRTGEELSFTDALPDDLQTALDSISDRSMGRTEQGEEILGSLQ